MAHHVAIPIRCRGPSRQRAAFADRGHACNAWFPVLAFRPEDYAGKLELVRSAASDTGRDPMSITPAGAFFVLTGRSRDEIDEALDSVIIRAFALGGPSEDWARHGGNHPLGSDFAGVQDLIPQTSDEQTVLSYAEKVPDSLLREALWQGTPEEVIDQAAEFRDHGLRYPVVLNLSTLQPSLRRGLAANVPFAKILRGLGKL